VDVFARPVTFDPQKDSLVRANMQRLRQLLDSYDADAGATDAWRLHLPKGRYTLQLVARQEAVGECRPAPSLAVLRIDNLAQDPKWNWFCDGTTLELVHLLTQNAALRVVIPYTMYPVHWRMGTSVKLSTDYALICGLAITDATTSSVPKHHLRFTAQLKEVALQRELWSREYAVKITLRSLRNVLEDVTWQVWNFVVAPHAPVARPPKGKMRWQFAE
jgi:TolB-like protein